MEERPFAEYLNNAGTSFPKPEGVERAILEALSAMPATRPELFETARQVVAARLDVAPPELLFTSGCTQALDVAISDLGWQQGDIVVTSSLEHHAMIRPIERLVRRLGVRHERVPYAPGSPFDLEALEDILRGGGARLVAVCTASNVTGEVLPLSEISKLAHAHGALVLADAAQTFGLLPDDVPALGCDLLTFAAHKAPLGPQGIGALWASKDVAFDASRAICEVGDTARGAECSPTMPGYCDVGGVNLPALCGLSAGLSAYGDARAERMRVARELAEELSERARTLDEVEVFGYRGAPHTAAVSLRYPSVSVERAEHHFEQRSVIVRGGAHCAPEALAAIGAPEGTLRISFGPESTEASLEAAWNALASLGEASSA